MHGVLIIQYLPCISLPPPSSLVQLCCCPLSREATRRPLQERASLTTKLMRDGELMSTCSSVPASFPGSIPQPGNETRFNIFGTGKFTHTHTHTHTHTTTTTTRVELTQQLSSTLLPHSEQLSIHKSSASLLQTLASLPQLHHLKTEQ